MRILFRIFILTILIVNLDLFAQDVTISASKPEKITFDRNFCMEILNIDEPRWNEIDDGENLSGLKREMLLFLFERMETRLPRSFLLEAAKTLEEANLSLEQLLSEPQKYRGEVFTLRGDAVFAEEYPAIPVEQSRYNVQKFYRVKVRLFPGVEVFVYARAIPEKWRLSEPIYEPVKATGVYLFRDPIATENEEKSAFLPAFVSPRVEWYPSDSLLGNIGFDLGLFDKVPTQPVGLLKVSKDVPFLRSRIDFQMLRWTDRDIEPFYSLLSATAKTKKGELDQIALDELKPEKRERSSVIEIFNHPEENQGELLIISGIAKRISPVMIESEEIQKRFGLLRYYEVYLYTPESGENPVIVCVTHLPEGMPIGSDDTFAEEVTVTGFFYKTWAYKIDATKTRRYLVEELEQSVKDRSISSWQFAPVLVGRGVIWHPDTTRNNTPPGGSQAMYAMLVLLILLLGIWFMYRFRRAPEKPIEFKISLKPENLSPEKSDPENGIKITIDENRKLS